MKRPSMGHKVIQETVKTTPYDPTIKIKKYVSILYQAGFYLVLGLVGSMYLLTLGNLPLLVVMSPLALSAIPFIREQIHASKAHGYSNRTELLKLQIEEAQARLVRDQVKDSDNDGTVSREEQRQWENDLAFFTIKLVNLGEKQDRRHWEDRYGIGEPKWQELRKVLINVGVLVTSGTTRKHTRIAPEIKSANQALAMIENSGYFKETSFNDHQIKSGTFVKDSGNTIASDGQGYPEFVNNIAPPTWTE